MEKVIDYLVGAIIGTFGLGGVIGLIIFLKKDELDKWLATFGYALNKLGGFFKFAHKKAAQLDLQGSINDYVKKVSIAG